MNCAIDNRPACDETEGWAVRLCSCCHWGLGSPEREPSWSAVYAIGVTLLVAEEQRVSPHEHPEALAYQVHFPADNPLQAAG